MRIPVLAVDDDRLVHAVLRVMFRRWNDLALDLAEDGKAALEKLAMRQYGLVLSDGQLPHLDGLGLLGFEAAFARDYPVMFGTLFFFSLLGLLMGLIGDLMYTVIDPRIDFEAREA